MHDHGTEVMFYSALLGATLPARALKQGLICFNLRRAEQTLTIGTLSTCWYIVPIVSVCSDWNKLNFVSIHVLVVRQHCARIEGFALSHINFLSLDNGPRCFICACEDFTPSERSLLYLSAAQTVGKACMYLCWTHCNTMHDHGTESRGHGLFRVTRGNTSGMCTETRFNLFQSVSSRTNTHDWYIVPLVSVCWSRHGLKQIKLCFNSRPGYEAALRSDRRLCLQSYYIYSTSSIAHDSHYCGKWSI